MLFQLLLLYSDHKWIRTFGTLDQLKSMNVIDLDKKKNSKQTGIYAISAKMLEIFSEF